MQAQIQAQFKQFQQSLDDLGDYKWKQSWIHNTNKARFTAPEQKKSQIKNVAANHLPLDIALLCKSASLKFNSHTVHRLCTFMGPLLVGYQALRYQDIVQSQTSATVRGFMGILWGSIRSISKESKATIYHFHFNHGHMELHFLSNTFKYTSSLYTLHQNLLKGNPASVHFAIPSSYAPIGESTHCLHNSGFPWFFAGM